MALSGSTASYDQELELWDNNEIIDFVQNLIRVARNATLLLEVPKLQEAVFARGHKNL